MNMDHGARAYIGSGGGAGGVAANPREQTELEIALADLEKLAHSIVANLDQVRSRVMPPTPDGSGATVQAIPTTYHDKVRSVQHILERANGISAELNGRI